MKKKTALILVVLLAVLGLAVFLVLKFAKPSVKAQLAAVPPQVPGEVVYIPFPVSIVLDGKLDDWADVPAYTVTTGPKLSNDPAENGSFTFAAAADAQTFYITLRMPDKNIVAGKHATNFWNEDSMEFYINASDDLNARKFAPKIFQMNFNAADMGNTDPTALTITGVNSADYKVNGYVFKTDDGWAVEAALPLEGLLTPSHGLEIGFQAQINGATTLDRDVKLIWSKADTSDQSWQLPILFGRAIFFELGSKDVPQPSVALVLPTVTPTPAPEAVGSQVNVNQTGYFAAGQKIASLALDASEPVEWTLYNSSGAEQLKGKTIVKGPDAASGDVVHIIDFSAFRMPGTGYQIGAGELKSAPFDISEDIYSSLKTDALAYFYHNRSGIAIEAAYVGADWARPAGHITDNNVTCYKGSDPDGNTWPGCDYTLDAAGGWYDAGDFGKYVVNGGISAWTLMNLYERFPALYPDGSLKIPEQGNSVPDLLDEARWEMEFLLSMQVPEGQAQAGMAHHKLHDRTWAGMPMIPPTEVDNNNDHTADGSGRYLFPPSTAATLNLAAAGAQCARIWQDVDADFAARCLKAAESAWAAALANPAVFAGNTPGEGGGNYDDTQVTDEFYWAAAELFISTGEEEYGASLAASKWFASAGAFDWGHTAPLGSIALAMHPGSLPEDQQALVNAGILAYADNLLAVQAKDGYSVPLEGDYPWGSNGLVLNNLMLLGLAHDLSGDVKYLDGMRAGMDYILGRNPLNKSYVSGYGEFPMEHPHHRFWANNPDIGFPPPPAGVVAGGPNSNPTDPEAVAAGLAERAPSKRYLDVIGSYTTNEVTINWNAPLAWVAAYLDQVRE